MNIDIWAIIRPILVILIFIFAIWLFYRYARPYFIKIDTVACFTGAPGTGKDLLGVDYAIAKYRQAVVNWKFKKRIFKFFRIKFNDPMPQLYSSIPILINNNLKKPIYSKKLTLEMIILQYRLPPKSVVYWSDINKSVNQWSFKKTLVQNNIAEFVTQFRHYTKGGYFILNAQSSDLIAKEIRATIGTIYNLIKHQSYFGIVHAVTMRRMTISESVVTVHESKMADNADNTMKKWLILDPSIRRYDTYAYYGRVHDMELAPNESYKMMNTNEYIQVPFDDIPAQTGDSSYVKLPSKDRIGELKLFLVTLVLFIILMKLLT